MIEIEEVWAEIEGFSEYAISNLGRVKNLRHDRLLTPRPNSYGYQRVALYRDGERHDLYVHRLVAAAFIDGYIKRYRVRHNDLDGENNHVYNLRFASGQRLGRLVRNVRRPIYRRLRVVETGMIFKTVEDCANYIGGDPSNIYRVLRGDRDSHKGYTFEYYYEEN